MRESRDQMQRTIEGGEDAEAVEAGHREEVVVAPGGRAGHLAASVEPHLAGQLAIRRRDGGRRSEVSGVP